MSVIERENQLKTKKICRFCLAQQTPLENIFARDARPNKMPLPILAISVTSMEVFSNDGMPAWICQECRLLFEHSYRFKQMCKRSETLLKQYPLTGVWPDPLAKPRIPLTLLSKRPTSPVATKKIITPQPTLRPAAQQSYLRQHRNAINPTTPAIINKNSSTANNSTKTASPTATSGIQPKKLLNANPVASPEPPVPFRLKREKQELENEAEIILLKADNDEELTLDDVQRLIAANDDDEDNFVNERLSNLNSGGGVNTTITKSKPRVLNKSSIRILNKEAELAFEPRISTPQVKRDEDGNVAIVTEILDPNTPYVPEPDPLKSATPVETNVYPCPHCERSFPLRQLRDIHMVNHQRERDFHCTECDKSFFSKYDLQKHVLVHSGDRPYKCTVCSKGFTRATLLHRHEKTHTDTPKFICIYCEKPFLSKEALEKHTQRHLKNRPFQCKSCDKSFAFKQGLERHEVVHSRDQPHPCQYCEQSFATPSKLARHLTAHAGKRPYPCKFCAKSYLLSHHLSRHMRSHKEEQGQDVNVSFQCGECKSVFSSRDELISHSAVHATQSLCCPLCKEIFVDVETVAAHIKAHADGDAYACEFCDLLFMTSSRLQAHTDTEHADDMLAYHEDDKANARAAVKLLESTTTDAELQQTVNEFFVEELQSPLSEKKVDVLSEKVIRAATPEKPKILKQLVLKSKAVNTSTLMDADDLLAQVKASKKGELVDQEDSDAPALKFLKTEKLTVATVSPSSSIRRKVVKDESGTTNRNPESINSVLKLLPKGVSVRRSALSTTPKSEITKLPISTDISTHETESVPAKPQKRVLRTSSRRSHETPTSVVKKSTSPSNRRGGGNKDEFSSEAVVPELKESKNAHKITLTRAEADAMKQDGRIRIKDGKMFLTQQNKQENTK